MCIRDRYQRRVHGESKWINRQRTLVVCSRGGNRLQKEISNEICSLLPHSKKEIKVERKNAFEEILSLCQMRSCNNFLYFESHKRKDLYMWIGRAPNGPCYRFQVPNVTLSKELKLTGNCIKGSRPLLCFDESFDSQPYLSLLKEMSVNIFGTPNFHPKSKPFIDHALSFTFYDNRIWFRNFQIVYEADKEIKLVEIGPRLTLVPIKIFDDFLSGEILWANPFYLSPSRQNSLRISNLLQRRQVKAKAKKMTEEEHSRELKEDQLNLFTKLSDNEQYLKTSMNCFLGSQPCLLYTSPSPRDLSTSRMPSSA
eukprot:TRINITY_DN35990_c0_g1_i1.p1 TRINITY_DN35990_c0_g1~~TRINITY_DN35990_c0_g1_i1.p1  ORF type:complete len:311 (+),score=41.24 TRINITY_DN35990_c0_g1_i1:159-1091(+)